MKKLIVILIFFIPFIGISQDRNVFWAHGYNGSGDFWNIEYARAQRDYRINSTGFSYNTNSGLVSYSNLLRNGSASIGGPQTIAIGHSMGGVAFREADKTNSNLYGGFITFGAPLDGAKAANAIIAGTPVTQFINQSLDNLRRGPIAEQAQSAWSNWRGNIIDVVNGGGASVLVRDIFAGLILDITDDLSGGLQLAIVNNYNPNDPSVQDLAENSSYFNSIKNYSNNKPKIFVYGEEESPVHARMFISGITFDDNFTNTLLTGYNGVGLAYKTISDGISIGFWPVCWQACRDANRRRKEAWYAGYEYINRGWEIAWNQLTGARYLESYIDYQDFYECNGGGPGPLRFESLVAQPICPIAPAMLRDNNQTSNDCGDCRWVTRPVTRTRWVNGSSDGFIKKSSTTAAISSWKGQEARLVGSNHLEMGVHPNTNPLLRRIFDGQGYNSYFFTTRR